MIGKTDGHYQISHGYLIVSRIACLFLTATALSWLVDPLTLSAPALEAAASPATLTVTKLADTNDGACDADCSLREALAVAAPNDTIAFAPPLKGTVTLNSTLTISKNVTIDGPSTESIIISDNNAVRAFYVEPDVHFTIKNLKVTKGYIKGTRGSGGVFKEVDGSAAEGAGLYNSCGTVDVI
jgi:CSLREA domain-containing protein